MLTKEEVEKALPANLKSAATQQLTDKVNQVVSDPLVAEQVRENFISYTHILQEGRFKTEDYLNAVVYVSYKLMGLSNKDAYAKTFPARFQSLVAAGKTEKDISAYVSMYAKNKLVNLILEQSLIPTHVLNQGIYQDAINQLAFLMKNARSEKVQADSAASLLSALQKPKEAAPAIQIDVKENSGMEELKNLLGELAKKQLDAINAGVETREIAAQPLIEGKVKEVDSK